MPTPTLTISVSPTAAPQSSPVFTITWDLSNYGDVTGGTLQAQVDGANVGAALSVGQPGRSFSITLPNTTPPGSHSIVLQFSGDPSHNVDPATSNTVPVIVTDPGGSDGGGTTPPPSSGTQAVARVVCAAGAVVPPSRTDRENGVYASQGYTVSSIAMMASGSGQYDSYTVGTLFGQVAGVDTRQTLTVALDDDGGISGLSGFDSTTVWDTPPKLTITRWDGSGPSANFLGS